MFSRMPDFLRFLVLIFSVNVRISQSDRYNIDHPKMPRISKEQIC